jgi:hypothetical protein
MKIIKIYLILLKEKKSFDLLFPKAFKKNYNY